MRDEARSAGWGKGVLWGVLLVVFTALPFLAALDGEFVYDDLRLVARDSPIRSLGGLARAFTEGYWDFLGEEAAEIGHWRPLAAVGMTLAYTLGGGEPWAFHLLSLLLHLGCTLVVFHLFRRLLGRAPPAWAGALLFGLHPAHVESVAWISALNDPLSGLFAGLALLAWLGWRRRGGSGCPWGAGLWLVPALLSKETALALVLMVPALEFGLEAEERRLHRVGRLLLPLLLALAAWWLARVLVFGDLAAGLGRGMIDFGFGPLRRALFPLELLGGFLRILLFPLGLAIFRPVRPTLEWGALLPLALVALYLAALWRSRPGPVRSGLLLVAAALVPILAAATSLGRFPLADRYLYLPALGYALVLAGFAARRNSSRPWIAALLLLAVACGVRTHIRTNVWSSREAFYRAAVAEAPRSPYPRWGQGEERLRRYKATGDRRRLAESRAAYQAAADLIDRIDRQPTLAYVTQEDRIQTRLGLAWCTFSEVTGPWDPKAATAQRLFQDLVQDFPRSHYAWNGLGVTYAAAGHRAAAEKAFRRALHLAPGNPEARQNLHRLLNGVGPH